MQPHILRPRCFGFSSRQKLQFGRKVCSQSMVNGWMAGRLEGRELKAMTGALYNLVYKRISNTTTQTKIIGLFGG